MRPPRFPFHRRLVAYAAIVAVVGGHLYDLAMDWEHWPFSPYPMYSHRMGNELTVYRLMGVVAGGSGGGAAGEAEAEIPLITRRYLWPLDSMSTAGALRRMHREPDREALLGEAMGDCLARYEARRAAGKHDGPPLSAIRLYRMTWEMDPWARNRDRPDRRELIYEARTP